jgi:hypothetical protein
MALPRGFQLDRWRGNFSNTLAATEIGPNIHDRATSIEAVGAPVGSLHRSPNLMA